MISRKQVRKKKEKEMSLKEKERLTKEAEKNEIKRKDQE
jgi:hypothetical protein